MSSAMDVLFFAFSWAYVLLVPYTKVEESFNMQATHDILTYGLTKDALRNFDHFSFSGPIPRTFIGSILLAWVSAPVINVVTYLGLITSKADLQIITRLVLATWNAAALSYIRRAVSHRFGRPTSFFFTILTCSQFHLLFWMSRTLPNMFALPLVNIALALLLDTAPNSTRIPEKSRKIALSLLGFATVVFRAELILLWAPISLYLLLQDQGSFFFVLSTNLLASVIATAATLFVDSYFWQKILLPELSSFLFNVAHGQSSNWGVSPFRSYFTVHLPKLLMTGLPLAFVGALNDTRISSLLLPYLAFILLISNLGHKEWRFIIYAVPAFNVAAARGLKYLTSRRKGTLLGQISFLFSLSSLLLNFLLTALSLQTSMLNYPGGEAIAAFHKLVPANVAPTPHVHISNLAAQSGVTLFQQLYSPPYYPSLFLNPNTRPPSRPWTYNKTEHLTLSDLSHSPHFTHLISEVPPTDPTVLKHWRLVKPISAFKNVVFDTDLLLRRRGELFEKFWDLLRIEQQDRLWIYERK